MRRMTVALAGAALMIGLGAGEALAQGHTMKLAIPTINDPLHEFIKTYKTEIEKRTGGAIKAELFPAGQLGAIPRLVEGVQLGTIEMFVTPPSFLKGVDTRFQVTDAPGIFDDLEHAHRAMTAPSFRTPFLALAEAKGVKGVSIFNYGPSSYATVKAIKTLADFRGQKLRVSATDIEIAILAAFGATGVPMPYGEVLPALQQKLVDGARANIVSMAAGKFYSVAKNLTVVKDGHFPCVAFVSTAFLAKLLPEHRKAVEEVGREIEPAILSVALKFDAEAEKAWRDNGAEVHRLSPAVQAEFLKQAIAAGDKILGASPGLKEMYDLLKASADATRRRS